jgi:hypothetical protein
MENINLWCLKCNITLDQTNLKRYCRGCINTIKNERIQTEDINKLCCNKCRCYKSTEEFKHILKNCKACRTRKENRITINNNSNAIIEDVTINKNYNTKINYKSKLQSILVYLKDKYNITESIEHLEAIDIKLKEDSDL